MSNSCLYAFISNIKTEISNMDSSLIYNIEKRRLKKNWQNAQIASASLIQQKTAQITSKYSDGFYVKNNYPGVPNEAIEFLKSKYNVTNLDDFYKYKIVGYNTNNIESCPNQSTQTFCKDQGYYQEKVCCECGKAYSCNPGIGGCDAWSGNKYCNLRLNTNIFEEFINSEITRETNIILDNVLYLRNLYESLIEPLMRPVAEIGCCQDLIIDSIKAGNVTVSNNGNTCTIVKS
jgi:hypothetical protein